MPAFRPDDVTFIIPPVAFICAYCNTCYAGSVKLEAKKTVTGGDPSATEGGAFALFVPPAAEKSLP